MPLIEKVTLKGDNALQRKLHDAKRRGMDLRPYWASAKVIVFKNTAERFKRGGGSRGMWAPLSETTLMLRRFGGHRPLQDQGNLVKSVTTEEGVVREDSHTLIIGSNQRQAALLQRGYRMRVSQSMRGFFLANGIDPRWFQVGTEIKVPPRPFLYIDSRDKKELGVALKFYFAAAIKKGVAG